MFGMRPVEACPGICLLDNPVQYYAWGSREAIPRLMGEANPEGRPFAELWMGAHPKAPSTLLMNGRKEALGEVIARFPEAILGIDCCDRFSGRLPFLFKVLAAEIPLSMQVHPNLVRARVGFVKENALGIPIDAPHRNYRDDNHKPEMLCALTPFLALKGFRLVDEILDLMDRVSLGRICGDLKRRQDENGLKAFFTALLFMEEGERWSLVSEAVASAERYAVDHPAFHWVGELNHHFPGDIGVISPLILNLVELKPGEAVFLHDGELHAYLSGMGLELMANSDNVLRGGLTPKHIDVPELLENLSFDFGPVSIFSPFTPGECEEIYPGSAEEFQLCRITVDEKKSFVSRPDRSVEILLCAEGTAQIVDLGSSEVTTVRSGKSVLVPASVTQYRIEGQGVVFKASVPI